MQPLGRLLQGALDNPEKSLVSVSAPMKDTACACLRRCRTEALVERRTEHTCGCIHQRALESAPPGRTFEPVQSGFETAVKFAAPVRTPFSPRVQPFRTGRPQTDDFGQQVGGAVDQRIHAQGEIVRQRPSGHINPKGRAAHVRYVNPG